jgi:hypothetical protein
MIVSKTIKQTTKSVKYIFFLITLAKGTINTNVFSSLD